ncbi:MAG: alpha/beta hydrolase [Marinicaulis sp.]|nr:alpha/beta hydrolase [Marinicaulis sp.]
MATEQIEISLSGGVVMRAEKFAGGENTPTICIPGLTRNAQDFLDLAPKIAATGRDVFAVNLRGRGPSDHDPEIKNYFPTIYRDDIFALMDQMEIGEAIFVGTSLGGIITMLANEKSPDRVKAAVLNDVGPDLAPEGLARIATYVAENANAGPMMQFEDTVARIKAINQVAFPDATEDQWRDFAGRTFVQKDDGEWDFYYDPNISAALIANGPAPDLWPAFSTLMDTPTLLMHGELSDLLNDEIVQKMRAACPDIEYIRVPRIGHAPFMTEPVAWAALERFFAKIG